MFARVYRVFGVLSILLKEVRITACPSLLQLGIYILMIS